METNVIYNEDCILGMQKIPDNSIDCVVTDVPYNGVNRKSNGLRNLDKSVADSAVFDLQGSLEQMYRVCKGSFYIFCGFGQISDIHKFFNDRGLSTRLIIWEKTNPSPMNGEFIWLSGIEPCVFARKEGATFNLHCANTVLRYPVAESTGHPTPKPVNLFGKLIQASSNVGDVILDPFAGGGTTAIACNRIKRKYILFEKDKEYYDIARRRIDLEERQLSLF